MERQPACNVPRVTERQWGEKWRQEMQIRKEKGMLLDKIRSMRLQEEVEEEIWAPIPTSLNVVPKSSNVHCQSFNPLSYKHSGSSSNIRTGRSPSATAALRHLTSRQKELRRAFESVDREERESTRKIRLDYRRLQTAYHKESKQCVENFLNTTSGQRTLLEYTQQYLDLNPGMGVKEAQESSKADFMEANETALKEMLIGAFSHLRRCYALKYLLMRLNLVHELTSISTQHADLTAKQPSDNKTKEFNANFLSEIKSQPWYVDIEGVLGGENPGLSQETLQNSDKVNSGDQAYPGVNQAPVTDVQTNGRADLREQLDITSIMRTKSSQNKENTRLSNGNKHPLGKPDSVHVGEALETKRASGKIGPTTALPYSEQRTSERGHQRFRKRGLSVDGAAFRGKDIDRKQALPRSALPRRTPHHKIKSVASSAVANITAADSAKTIINLSNGANLCEIHKGKSEGKNCFKDISEEKLSMTTPCNRKSSETGNPSTQKERTPVAPESLIINSEINLPIIPVNRRKCGQEEVSGNLSSPFQIQGIYEGIGIVRKPCARSVYRSLSSPNVTCQSSNAKINSKNIPRTSYYFQENLRGIIRKQNKIANLNFKQGTPPNMNLVSNQVEKFSNASQRILPSDFLQKMPKQQASIFLTYSGKSAHSNDANSTTHLSELTIPTNIISQFAGKQTESPHQVSEPYKVTENHEAKLNQMTPEHGLIIKKNSACEMEAAENAPLVPWVKDEILTGAQSLSTAPSVQINKDKGDLSMYECDERDRYCMKQMLPSNHNGGAGLSIYTSQSSELSAFAAHLCSVGTENSPTLILSSTQTSGAICNPISLFQSASQLRTGDSPNNLPNQRIQEDLIIKHIPHNTESQPCRDNSKTSNRQPDVAAPQERLLRAKKHHPPGYEGFKTTNSGPTNNLSNFGQANARQFEECSLSGLYDSSIFPYQLPEKDVSSVVESLGSNIRPIILTKHFVSSRDSSKLHLPANETNAGKPNPKKGLPIVAQTLHAEMKTSDKSFKELYLSDIDDNVAKRGNAVTAIEFQLNSQNQLSECHIKSFLNPSWSANIGNTEAKQSESQVQYDETPRCSQGCQPHDTSLVQVPTVEEIQRLYATNKNQSNSVIWGAPANESLTKSMNTTRRDLDNTVRPGINGHRLPLFLQNLSSGIGTQGTNNEVIRRTSIPKNSHLCNDISSNTQKISGKTEKGKQLQASNGDLTMLSPLSRWRNLFSDNGDEIHYDLNNVTEPTKNRACINNPAAAATFQREFTKPNLNSNAQFNQKGIAAQTLCENTEDLAKKTEETTQVKENERLIDQQQPLFAQQYQQNQSNMEIKGTPDCFPVAHTQELEAHQPLSFPGFAETHTNLSGTLPLDKLLSKYSTETIQAQYQKQLKQQFYQEHLQAHMQQQQLEAQLQQQQLEAQLQQQQLEAQLQQQQLEAQLQQQHLQAHLQQQHLQAHLQQQHLQAHLQQQHLHVHVQQKQLQEQQLFNQLPPQHVIKQFPLHHPLPNLPQQQLQQQLPLQEQLHLNKLQLQQHAPNWKRQQYTQINSQAPPSLELLRQNFPIPVQNKGTFFQPAQGDGLSMQMNQMLRLAKPTQSIFQMNIMRTPQPPTPLPVFNDIHTHAAQNC